MPAYREKITGGHSKKGLSASQRERPQGKPDLPTPWSWASSLQNCVKRSFCCLSYPICSILLWHQQLNTWVCILRNLLFNATGTVSHQLPLHCLLYCPSRTLSQLVSLLIHAAGSPRFTVVPGRIPRSLLWQPQSHLVHEHFLPLGSSSQNPPSISLCVSYGRGSKYMACWQWVHFISHDRLRVPCGQGKWYLYLLSL